MPQIFQVLRCYKCLVFQVHQTKKSNKWECKMCSAKQSVKRHYGIGTAKDCRLHVQKLNGIRGELDELKEQNVDSDSGEEFNEDNKEHDVKLSKLQRKSKWSNYIEKCEDVTEPDTENTMYLNNTEVVLEIPKKRKRSFKAPVLKSSLGNSNSEDKTIDNSQFKISKNSYCDASIHDNDLATIPMIHSETKDIAISKISEANITKFEVINGDRETPVSSQKNFSLKLIPQEVKGNSKWAQFVEEDIQNNDQNDENDAADGLKEDDFQSHIPHSQDLFTLCDDGDLDSVLDI